MRLAHPIDSSIHAHALQDDAPAADLAGDALASACLFGIVGGLLFGVAVIPTVSAVLVGAALGAIVGVVIAYH